MRLLKLDSTLAVSRMVSFTPSCTSPGPRNSACPPSSAMPVSDDTRVRVDRFWKIIATLSPANGASSAAARFTAGSDDRCAALSARACARSPRSSAGEKSSIAIIERPARLATFVSVANERPLARPRQRVVVRASMVEGLWVGSGGASVPSESVVRRTTPSRK